MHRLVLDCATGAGASPVLATPEGVEAVRRRSADGTDHLFLLNHTSDEVSVDLRSVLSRPVDLLDAETPAPVTGPLRLPPFGAAVLRDAPRGEH